MPASLNTASTTRHARLSSRAAKSSSVPGSKLSFKGLFPGPPAVCQGSGRFRILVTKRRHSGPGSCHRQCGTSYWFLLERVFSLLSNRKRRSCSGRGSTSPPAAALGQPRSGRQRCLSSAVTSPAPSPPSPSSLSLPGLPLFGRAKHCSGLDSCRTHICSS